MEIRASATRPTEHRKAVLGHQLNDNAIMHYNDDYPLGGVMTRLTVTARGQVTFRRKVMQHLGVKPGDKIELDLIPDSQGVIRAARAEGTIEAFIGSLAGKTKKTATIEELNEAAARGWSDEKMAGKK